MRTLLTAVVISVVFVAVAIAAPKGKVKKHAHQSGHSLVQAKLKTNGTHQIHKRGKHAVSADVKDGKIAGFHVKHDTKGDVAVKKYKSKKKYASIDGTPDLTQPADTDLGTTWIAYAYEDEDTGEEVYYWFPYEMILDGDTGAIEYVPLS